MKHFWIVICLFASMVSGCGARPPSAVQPVESPTNSTVLNESAEAETSTPLVESSAGFDPAFYSDGTHFIPLDDPKFIPAKQADYVDPDEYVLGITWQGEARAYPVEMMWFHHIVNDSVKGHPILITY